jgi:hypothetical protein
MAHAHETNGGWSHQPLDTLTVEVHYYVDMIGDVIVDKACVRDQGPVCASCFHPEQIEQWKEAIETERSLHFADEEERGREWLDEMRRAA